MFWKKKCGQTVESKSIDEDTNLGETSDICGQDNNRAVWGATAI